MNARDFQDKVAIVTGAGSGIGRAIALGLAAAGAKVIVHDIVAARTEETVSFIAAQGGQASGVVADVADEAAVDRLVSETLRSWGQIDIVCNNAGIMDRMESAPDLTLETWNRVFSVNSTGPFLVSRAVLPHMLGRRRGAIVNIASVAGLRGGAAGLAYTASKHALIGLTRSIAWMHSEDGIRCNAVCPGSVRTNIIDREGGQFNESGAARTARVTALVPRLAEPGQIAEAAIFLASDAADYVNGAILPVDSGWLAG